MADKKPEQRLLGMSEAAAALGVHPNTLRGWLKRGLIAPAVRLPSGYSRFTPEQISALRESMGLDTKTAA